MQNQLQAASEVMERLLEPANLAQIVVIAVAWWSSAGGSPGGFVRDLGARRRPARLAGTGTRGRLGRGAHWR